MMTININNSVAKKTLLTLGTFLVTLLMITNTTFAIGASPLKMEYQATPGQTVNGQLTVYNTSDTKQKIIIEKSDFDMDEKSNGVQFLNAQNANQQEYQYSLQQWISLPEEDIIVEAKQKTVIRYKITVPADAPAQGYYGALFVRSEPITDANQPTSIGVRLTTQVAHLVLLNVEGSIQNVTLKDFTIDPSTIETSEITTDNPFFDIVVYNDGNVHSSPEGTIEIIDTKGNIVEEFDMNAGDNNVLPQKEKTYFSEGYVKDIPAGTYYAVLDGKAENGQQLQGKITFSVDRQGKVEMIDKYMGAVDMDFLKGSAHQKYIIFQTTLAILSILIFTVAFVAIGRYCIVSSKAFNKKSFYKFFRKK
jgi:hypothetical protein